MWRGLRTARTTNNAAFNRGVGLYMAAMPLLRNGLRINVWQWRRQRRGTVDDCIGVERPQSKTPRRWGRLGVRALS
jgi:hypothetical protein